MLKELIYTIGKMRGLNKEEITNILMKYFSIIKGSDTTVSVFNADFEFETLCINSKTILDSYYEDMKEGKILIAEYSTLNEIMEGGE